MPNLNLDFHFFLIGSSLILLFFFLWLIKTSAVYIPNGYYGIVERKWSFRSAGRETFGLIAIAGGVGYLPSTLRAGWHFFFPTQYRVHQRKLITIDQIANLIARVGASLDEGQALGAWPKYSDGRDVNIEDGLAFLTCGGQRGPQRQIVRSGTHAINTVLFCLLTNNKIETGFSERDISEDDKEVHLLLKKRDGFNPIVIHNDSVGIVSVQDGPALMHGEIIAPTVGTDAADKQTFHNSFQDINKFLHAGGARGRQEQVLVEGTYYINRLFATVEVISKTKVEIGTVGVINSYVASGKVEQLTIVREAIDPATRSRTVPVGQRGIWEKALEPGKYALNTYAMELTLVPTTNFQLRWIEGTSGNASMPAGMNYDDDLKEIPARTNDGFDILVPLSIVAHISPANAPHVIQRFSKVQRLVNQTLDPLISAYFKDSAQQYTALDFIQSRKEISDNALAYMKTRLSEHKIEIEEVMLGTPRAPKGDMSLETMLNQLRLRQIAGEQEETYKAQQKAATQQQELNKAQALSDQQTDVTRSLLSITIAENTGKAETSKAKQAAEGIKATADAEAYAARIRAEAVGGPQNLMRQTALTVLGTAIRETKQPLVPSVMVGGSESQDSNLVGLLTALAVGKLDRS